MNYTAWFCLHRVEEKKRQHAAELTSQGAAHAEAAELPIGESHRAAPGTRKKRLPAKSGLPT